MNQETCCNLIINADDFGISSSTNRAIVSAFEKGFISSTTLVANGIGFEEACEMAHDKILTNNIGIHINLSEGFPLTSEIAQCPRLCDENGAFQLQKQINNARYFWPPLNSIEKVAIFNEVRAQITKCRQNGIPLFHADSHHHIHTEWSLASIIIQVLKREKIGFLRLSRNLGTGIGIHKRIYKNLFNFKIKSSGLGVVKYFGSIDDLFLSRNLIKANTNIEVMCHPIYMDNSKILKDLDGFDIENKLLKLNEAFLKINMISYLMLKKLQDND